MARHSVAEPTAADSAWEGLVPASALHVPAVEELRDVDKSGAAYLLDGALRNLGRARAILERQLGRRLHRLRATDGLIELGCARLAEYAELHLELGGRSAEEMARLAGALEELPILRQACDNGTLSCSHLRELVRIATPETEAAWLERAKRLTVRGLREVIREERKRTAGEHELTGAEVSATADGNADDDNKLTLSFEAPAWFAAKWTAAVDLFRKLEGRDDLPESAAAEAFAAEWRSGAPLASSSAPASGTGRSPEEIAALWAEARAAWRADRQKLETGLEQGSERWAFLDAIPNQHELPGWLLTLDGGLSDDAFVLDAELHALEAWRRRLDGMTGRILLTMSRLGLFRAMLFADMEHYVRERLGLGASTAKSLKRIERLLFLMPAVQQAYLGGEIGLAKLRQLVRVYGTSDDAAWLARARRVTARRLEDEVRCVALRASLMCAGVMRRRQNDDPWGVLPEGLNLGVYMSALAEHARKAPFGGGATFETASTVRFAADPELARFWKESVAVCKNVHGPHLSEWECADRFLDAFFEAHDRPDAHARAFNHRIFARDGWRCTAPGCRSRRELHAHHLQFRSAGGQDTDENATTLCSCHHLQATHKGRIRIQGRAPDGLVWELGRRPDGQPVLVVGPGETIMRRAAHVE